MLHTRVLHLYFLCNEIFDTKKSDIKHLYFDHQKIHSLHIIGKQTHTLAVTNFTNPIIYLHILN